MVGGRGTIYESSINNQTRNSFRLFRWESRCCTTIWNHQQLEPLRFLRRLYINYNFYAAPEMTIEFAASWTLHHFLLLTLSMSNLFRFNASSLNSHQPPSFDNFIDQKRFRWSHKARLLPGPGAENVWCSQACQQFKSCLSRSQASRPQLSTASCITWLLIKVLKIIFPRNHF